MGNTNKKGVRGPISVRKSSAQEEPQLAPVEVAETESRDAECPICFISYSALNTVACCRQSLCTVCYLQMKGGGPDHACPFCGRSSLQVVFAPSATLDGATPTSTPTPNPTPQSSIKIPAAKTQDEGPPRTPQSSSPASSVPTASKSDRAALEAEIRNQRVQEEEEEMQRMASRYSEPGFYSPFSSPPPGAQSRSSWAGGGDLPGPRSRARRRNQNESGAAGANSAESSDRFLSSLQTLLESTHMDQVSSLDQLEEIMLMEAIRQSMIDAQNMPQPPPPPEQQHEEPAAPVAAPVAAPLHSMSERPTESAATPPSEVNWAPTPDSRAEPSGLEHSASGASVDVETARGHAHTPSSTLLEQIERALSTPPMSPGFLASPTRRGGSILGGGSRQGESWLLSESSEDEAC